MSKLRLTMAQHNWLQALHDSPTGKVQCVRVYKPHRAMVALGFVHEREHVYDYVEAKLTELGREWLAENTRRKK